MVGGDCAIVRFYDDTRFSLFDIGARFQMSDISNQYEHFRRLELNNDALHDLLVKLGPIRDTAVEAAYMNKIEAVLGIDPFGASVINLELQIWRDFARLNW